MTHSAPDADASAYERAIMLTLADPFLGHDTAAVMLSAALSLHDDSLDHAAELMAWLDDAARPLFGAVRAPLREQAELLRDVVAEHLPLAVGVEDPDGLLLGDALQHRGAHPLLSAVVGHELARRAGLSSVVAHGVGRDWTLLVGNGTCVPIGVAPADGAGTGEVPRIAEQLRVCCAHEAAYRTASAVARHGRPSVAAVAARIRGVLEALEGSHAPR